MKRLLCIGLMTMLFSVSFAEEKNEDKDRIYSREEIAVEIKDAERQFREAKEMFNPWYAGPLLTPSPNIIGPGLFNIQPYLFVTNNDKRYTRSGSRQDIPTLFQINPQVIGQLGLVNRLEILVILSALYSKRNGRGSFNYGDTGVKFGLEILRQTPYLPAIAFDVGESFPSGKYQKLDPSKGGVDVSGSGSYQTDFSLNIGKVVWWIPSHPMDVRWSFNYTINSNVHVKEFNAYGGGYGTNGTIRGGNNFTGDFGYEYSFTKKWVIACDVVYTYNSPTKFSGNPGVDSLGNPAVVGSSFNDQLSLAPALEYNPSANLGYLAGVWFTVYGRNSLSFISGVFTLEYTF